MGYGGGGDTTAGFGAGKLGQPDIRNGKAKPILEKTKAVSYDATTSDQIFAISADASATSKEGMPNKVEVENIGGVPLMVMAGYETYSDDTTDGVTEYLHTMVMPGETYVPPIRAIIVTGESSAIMDGTAVENTAPASVMYVDSTAKTTEGFADDDDTTITFDNAAGGSAGSMFKVNDLIRLDNEICRVVSLTDTVFTVDRAVHGTAKADHTNNTDIRLPFFNAYHDFD